MAGGVKGRQRDQVLCGVFKRLSIIEDGDKKQIFKRMCSRLICAGLLDYCLK